MPDKPLAGRCCLITGATGGLGAAIATAFCQAGASLALAGRDAKKLDSLRAHLASTAGPQQELVAVAADLDDAQSADGLADEVSSQLGGLTVLVNNAGLQGPIGSLWENDPQLWERTIRVNLIAPAALCARAIPLMRRRGYGKIINVSGGGATSSRPRFSAYAASKAALVRLTEVLADETKGLGIDINAIAPGAMNTKMTQEVLAAGAANAGESEYNRAERLRAEGGVPPERAADLAVFLASAASDGITGRLISAAWDNWQHLPQHWPEVQGSDIYTLRRIVPKDRGKDWT